MGFATAWDDSGSDGNSARGWSVMGTLRARQQRLRQESRGVKAPKHTKLSCVMTNVAGVALPITLQSTYEDLVKGRWRGGPAVLAFLFAQPDSQAMEMLDARAEYFDHRTGDTWDLFLPGYYSSREGADFERRAGAVPTGQYYTRDWYFHPGAFNSLREHIERSSEGRWHYSGGTDLVLIGGWMPDVGEPMIDWQSTISGRVTDPATATTTLSLPEIIEHISRDIEESLEAADYGVGNVTGTGGAECIGAESRTMRDVMINALGGIIAALVGKATGVG
jgi:hypothetical protein